MVVSQTAPDSAHERTFVFTFDTGRNQEKKTLNLQVNIAETQNCEELAARVCAHHNIPCFVEDDLKKELQNFVESERVKISDEAASALIKKFREKPDNASKIAKNIASKYKKTWAGFSKSENVDEQEEFATMYHKLIHSKVMTLLLSLEENYYHAVRKVISDQENSMTRLCERQELEMQRTCEHVSSGSLYTENDVNVLAAKHSSDTERLLGEWKNKYSKLVQNQRKEYRDAVSRLYGEMMANNGEVDVHGLTYIEVKKIVDCTQRSREMHLTSLPDQDASGQYEASPSKRFQKQKDSHSSPDLKQQENAETTASHQEFVPRLEESFTINLGAQMKTMHNIRLVAAPILHFCRHSNQSGDLQAQRLQTVLSLYSNSLSGLVLLVDNNIDSVSALKSDFSAICDSSTEFHFATYSEQIAEIKCRKAASSLDQLSIKSEDSLSIDSSSSGRSSNEGDFQDGDFYVTKHSNLSKVHIVFPLAANVANLRSSESSSTLNSRDPVFIGLRHILKVMSSHDLSTLMIPILLCHELLDGINEAWMVKRAELVMKCIKGFMMEMAAWDGGTSRTIQFVLPPGISEATFYRLSAMLPEIFRTTSARNLTVNKKVAAPAPASPRPGKR